MNKPLKTCKPSQKIQTSLWHKKIDPKQTPKFTTHCSNQSSNQIWIQNANSGGTAFFVLKEFSQSFNIEPEILVEGYVKLSTLIQRLAMTQVSSLHRSQSIISTYHRDQEWWRMEYQKRRGEPVFCYIFRSIAKSLNTHSQVEIGTLQKMNGIQAQEVSPKTERDGLAGVIAHFKLHEINQPRHTRTKGNQSSRLDRFYISHSLAEKCTMRYLG